MSAIEDMLKGKEALKRMIDAADESDVVAVSVLLETANARIEAQDKRVAELEAALREIDSIVNAQGRVVSAILHIQNIVQAALPPAAKEPT